MSSLDEQYNLWKQYTETKDISIRDELIIKYLNLVKYVAGRMNIYLGSNIEYDDLVSYGIFGLIDAIDKYDLNKGTKFETYASLRIRGSIIDSIREMDWVPRSLRQKSKDFEKAHSDLELENGRPPTDEEVAYKLNITMQEYNKLLNEVNLVNLVSLDDLIEKNIQVEKETILHSDDESPEHNLELIELKTFLGESIDKLPEKEKLVISLYYFEELTLKEISLIMKVSESRVSQLHTKAIIRLKDKIKRYIET